MVSKPRVGVAKTKVKASPLVRAKSPKKMLKKPENVKRVLAFDEGGKKV